MSVISRHQLKNDIDESCKPIAKVIAVCAMIFMVSGNALPASACGFHKPQDLFYGALELSYPQSLSVFGAVTSASQDGLLTIRDFPQTRDFFAYHRTVKQLTAFPRLLESSGAGDNETAFSLVLIDTMLWTRFDRTTSGYSARIHDDQPSYGELVVVTHGEVLEALVDGELGLNEALDRGLLRTYGPEGHEGEFLKDILQKAANGMNGKSG